MKKILFISPKFFSYSELIQEQLEKCGYHVDWFDDRPSTSIIDKCILRINRNFLKSKIHSYFYNRILTKYKSETYDYVLVILGQSFTKQMFLDMKNSSNNLNTKFILYFWDSIKNFPLMLEMSEAFDSVLSFDSYDCEKYGFKFLPLFYVKEDKTTESFKYNATFIGTIKKGKLEFLNNLKKELNEIYSNNYFYYYLQSKLVYLYNKLFNKEFKKMKINDFAYKKISYETNLNICLESNIIIDVPMKNQNGLSMRTFECIGLHKKMITTNKNVMNYDFYKPENIYYYDGKSLDLNNVFFKSKYIELDHNIIEKYSIQSRIKNILMEG